MSVKPLMLLWNSGTRTYQGVHEMDGVLFIAVDLGYDFERAKTYVKEYNDDI